MCVHVGTHAMSVDIIVASYCYSNKLSVLKHLKFILQFWRLEIGNESQWAKIQASAGFLEALGEGPFSCLFQLLGLTVFFGLESPSVFKVSSGWSWGSRILITLTLTLPPSASTYRSLVITLAHLDNPR